MNKKSEVLKELSDLQHQIELMGQALKEVENIYCKSMSGNFVIKSDSYNQEIRQFELYLDIIESKDVLKYLIESKRTEYKKMFDDLMML